MKFLSKWFYVIISDVSSKYSGTVWERIVLRRKCWEWQGRLIVLQMLLHVLSNTQKAVITCILIIIILNRFILIFTYVNICVNQLYDTIHSKQLMTHDTSSYFFK